jgi:hypothetical protein
MDITKATKHEIFAHVVAHLKSQGKKAKEGEMCKYRTSDGLKCAVGCLIDDDRYSQDMEGLVVTGDIVLKAIGTTIDELRQDRRLLSTTYNLDDIYEYSNLDTIAVRVSMIMKLQSIHDASSEREWPRALLRCGVSFKVDEKHIRQARLWAEESLTADPIKPMDEVLVYSGAYQGATGFVMKKAPSGMLRVKVEDKDIIDVMPYEVRRLVV